MSQIISRVTKPVRRRGAEKYLQLNLLSFAASVTITRFFLELTGYPQLGNETLHIAHVYANRWAYTWTSLISGVGIGLFIDEVGKFITQNNDYFFPAAAPIIYAFFLTSVLIYSRVTKEIPLDTRTELYAVLESLEEAIDHKLDPEEHDELKERLKHINEKAQNTDLERLADHILEFVDSEAIHISPSEPGPFDRATNWFSGFEGRWLSQERLRLFITVGILIIGLAASFRLIYYIGVSSDPLEFKILLQERVANLPIVTDMALFWATVQVGMEGIVGLILLFSAVLLFFGREKGGLGWGSIGLLISLVGVNLIQFYIDQFSTIAKALIQFVILQTLYYYQRRFRIK
jgi:hypothetical protein